MLMKSKIMENLKTSEFDSVKINIRKDERFSVLKNELSSDSKIEIKFARGHVA